MAKLTRKEKKELRIKLRKFLACVIRGTDVPVEMGIQGNEEVTAYLRKIKTEVADSLDSYLSTDEPDLI